MTDYDLGKARGRIVVDVDERGFRKAEGANDRLATSAHRVAEGFIDADKAQEDYRKQVKKTEQAEEALQRKQSEAQKALNRLNEAQAVANRLKEEGKTKTERYKQAVEAANKAQNRYTEAVSEAASAESKLNNEIGKVNRRFRDLQNALSQDNSINDKTQQIDALTKAIKKTGDTKVKVNVDSSDAMTKLKKLRKEHDFFLKSLSYTGNVGLKGLAVGGIGSGLLALGGLGGLAAGGLTGFGVNGIMATVQAIGQLSGVVGLLPVVIGNLTASIGTIVIASQNMGDAFSAVVSNDAKAFGEALKKLSTSGQEVAIAFNDIYPVLQEFQKAVQNEFFKGIADEMRELSATYLPMLQKGFEGFAQIINWTLKDLADWAQQSNVIADFKTVIDNLATTMGVLAPTARMLADTFLDIFKVSTDFGPSLATSFQVMVRDFRDFIDTARADGSLARWIQTGIDSFSSLMRSLKLFGQAFGTIFEIQNKYSGGFFGFIERVATALNDWTKSAEGNAALNEFFRSITDLSKALTPVLGSLANIIVGQIIPMFADFGTAIQPGILAFLKGFSDALKTLNPYMQQLAGPMNDLLAALGTSLVDIVKTLGPQLPAMFKAFADAILQILPHLPEIAQGVVDMAQSFIKYGPGIIENLIKLIPLIITVTWVLSDLAVLLTAGAVKIVAGLVDIGGGILDFLSNMIQVWPYEAGKAIREFIGSMDISADIDIVKGWFSEFFSNLGRQLSEGWAVLLSDLDGLKDKIWNWLKDLPSKAFDSGKAIVDDLISGMLDRLGPLGIVARTIAEAVSDHLPSSPAKKGPFSGRGWARYRGQKLSEDFAEGIVIGSGQASTAGGTLSKATASGMEQFVNDVLQISSLGQSITSFIGDIANNFLQIAKLATTNPITGESIFPKRWKRTATDDELRRIKEDRAFQKKLDEEEKAQREAEKKAREEAGKLRPDRVSPPPEGAPDLSNIDPERPLREPHLRRLMADQPRAANSSGYMGDSALLSRINLGSGGAQYISKAGFGDLTEGLGDCTSTIEDLINIMDGRGTAGREMATGNAPEWLTARGFLPTDTPMPGTFQVGFFNDPSAPGGGHMQATLPDGTKWNWGDNASAALSAQGMGNSGAWDDPRFNRFYYRPVDGMQNVRPRSPVPPPPPNPNMTGGFMDGRRINEMNDPAAAATIPGSRTADEFIRMSDHLEAIDNATNEQLDQQDIMINELRARDPMLDAAIKVAEDSNSTDAQVGSALDQISDIAKNQRLMDTAQSRYIADGLDSMTTEIAGGRGMSQIQQDPIGTTANLIGGALGIVGDVFKVIDTGIKAIGAASNIADTAVRGIENTEDIYKIVDEIQKFYELAAAVSQTVSDGLAIAGVIAMAAGGGQDGGLTGSILQAASAVAGIVTSVIQTINAGIDIAQEVYNIGSKYFGKWLSKLVGAGEGSLMGDVRMLLDLNTMELKTWSGDNPTDKRSFDIPGFLGYGQPLEQQGKIRDINMYIGPGTDPNEAMNAAMWSIRTDNGVFTTASY